MGRGWGGRERGGEGPQGRAVSKAGEWQAGGSAWWHPLQPVPLCTFMSHPSLTPANRWADAASLPGRAQAGQGGVQARPRLPAAGGALT